MTTPAHIGELIRERRLERGLSLGQLATQLGLAPAVVRSWERGNDAPSDKYSEPLVTVLGFDPADLAIPPGVEVAGEADEAFVAEPKTRVETASPKYSDAASTVTAADADISNEQPILEREDTDADTDGDVADSDEDEISLTEAPVSEKSSEAESAQPIEPLVREPVSQKATGELGEAPTEAMAAPVATMAPPVGRTTETPSAPMAIERPPPLIPNPLRALFDPSNRYIYWIRYALTVVVLLVLARVLLWAAGELWTALGEFLDTFEATDGDSDAAGLFGGS